jgi:hypothetical protein
VPSDAPEQYFKQINGEVKRETVEAKTKRSVWRWIPIGENHAWDCEYYQVAAALICNVLRLDYWSFHNLGDVTAFKKRANQGRAFRHSF